MPKKVVLSRRTMGTCIMVLRQLLRGSSSHQYFRNQKPLGKLTKIGCSILSKHRWAEVTVHPFAKENPKSNVLIHVFVNRDEAFVLREGDALYLFGGKKIIVDSKSSGMFSCDTLKPRIYRDLCVIKSL